MTPASCGGVPGFIPRPGGSLLNVAVGLGRLGVPVGFLGGISGDFFGDQLRAHLESSNVYLTYALARPEPTPMAFVQLLDNAEPEYAFYMERTADASWSLGDLPQLDGRVEGLHFGSLSLVRPPASEALWTLMRREYGQRVISLDPNVRPNLIANREAYTAQLERGLEFVDLIKVSRADLAWLYPTQDPLGVAASWTDTSESPVVVVTMGTDGAVGFVSGVPVRVSGLRVSVVDTIGAGDAFMAGLLAMLRALGVYRPRLSELGTEVLRQAMAHAVRVSAFTCMRAGADPPRAAEL